ncbi:hypothetical protein T492DRAFT_1144462 [Pavlovales sp. CCMP2436]|nr:hypothetical protein T492DRAFT_1144462 [Pavlovales sp. CCMP2436]
MVCNDRRENVCPDRAPARPYSTPSEPALPIAPPRYALAAYGARRVRAQDDAIEQQATDACAGASEDSNASRAPSAADMVSAVMPAMRLGAIEPARTPARHSRRHFTHVGRTTRHARRLPATSPRSATTPWPRCETTEREREREREREQAAAKRAEAGAQLDEAREGLAAALGEKEGLRSELEQMKQPAESDL